MLKRPSFSFWNDDGVKEISCKKVQKISIFFSIKQNINTKDEWT
jgi:hypothetical protein